MNQPKHIKWNILRDILIHMIWRSGQNHKFHMIRNKRVTHCNISVFSHLGFKLRPVGKGDELVNPEHDPSEQGSNWTQRKCENFPFNANLLIEA